MREEKWVIKEVLCISERRNENLKENLLSAVHRCICTGIILLKPGRRIVLCGDLSFLDRGEQVIL